MILKSYIYTAFKKYTLDAINRGNKEMICTKAYCRISTLTKLHQEILNEYNPTVHKMRFDLLCKYYVEEVAREFHQHFIQTIIITEAQSLLLFSKIGQYLEPEKIS